MQPTRRRKRGDPLTPAQAVEAIRARVAANGSERLSLKGRTLDGPAAVRAACDAILALHPPTVTLNLTGAEVCSGGADALADFLMNERCAVEELCLVDNPRLGVHMADTGVAARDIPDRGEDEPVTDGGGTAALARALARIGAWESVTHLSSVSGGSWFSSLFFYLPAFHEKVVGNEPLRKVVAAMGDDYSAALERALTTGGFRTLASRDTTAHSTCGYFFARALDA